MRGFFCRNRVEFGKEINHSPALQVAAFGKTVKAVGVDVQRKAFLLFAFRASPAPLAVFTGFG